MRSAHPLTGPNRLKLGVFCANTMPAFTVAPDLFRPIWSDVLTVARMADDAGFEAFVPIARWKGYVDENPGHPSHEVLEPFTVAAALAQATRNIAVFATTHAPTVHPLIVAKQAATIDAISNGRFALNVVGGWNRREFDMFGIDLLDHDARYDYLAEWLGVVRRLWAATDELDVETTYFHMKRAISRPRPSQGSDIPIMNAGYSDRGRRFAAEHSDMGLIGLIGEDERRWTEQIASYKRMALETAGKQVQVWTNAHLLLRESDELAQSCLRRYFQDEVDGIAVESYVNTLARENNVPSESDHMRFLRRTAAYGSAFPLIGSAATVVDSLARLSCAGLDGVILTCVDFVDSLHRFNRDVLPLLKAAGLREV